MAFDAEVGVVRPESPIDVGDALATPDATELALDPIRMVSVGMGVVVEVAELGVPKVSTADEAFAVPLPPSVTFEGLITIKATPLELIGSGHNKTTSTKIKAVTSTAG